MSPRAGAATNGDSTTPLRNQRSSRSSPAGAARPGNGDSSTPASADQVSVISAPQTCCPLLDEGTIGPLAGAAATGARAESGTGAGVRRGCAGSFVPAGPPTLTEGPLTRVPVADCQRSMIRFTSMFNCVGGPPRVLGRYSDSGAAPGLKMPSSIPHRSADIGSASSNSSRDLMAGTFPPLAPILYSLSSGLVAVA